MHIWPLFDWIFLSVEVTKAQIYHKVTDCCSWPDLYCWEMNIRSQNLTTVETHERWGITLRVSWSPTGFGRRCQCAKGTQDTESSISNDALKPDGALITSANKETKRKLPTIFWGSYTCPLETNWTEITLMSFLLSFGTRWSPLGLQKLKSKER